VTGEVINGLPNVITSVQVFGVFYDADNKIVGTGFTYAEPQTIAPGSNASFDLPLAEEISISQEKIQNYSVQAYYQ
jgi:hypothetical protein